ncbi:MAG: hypothetical protein M1840_007293 [Geoglossum simile]|nr:MAG: hypothetical protein M1840_007293 [Geoglossum simile]
MRVRLFNIIYSTTFSLLSIVLLVLLLVTPADSIRQAFNNRHFYNLAAIAGAYLLTAILALLIYSSRLYTNRSALQGIPKAWVPIEKGDVGRSVAGMIEEGLRRSATVARDARPRDLRADEGGERGSGSLGGGSVVRDGGAGGLLQRTDHERQDATVTVPPVWGHIAHPGHSSPSSPGFPNLHYLTVILELPHLIEAKAVSLAPPSPSQTATTLARPSSHGLSVLQRPSTMSLHEYLNHLTGLNLIKPPALGEEFLTRYEGARFSGVELKEEEFRELLGVFAQVLGGMVPEELDRKEEGEEEMGSFVSGSTMSGSSGSFESFVPSTTRQGSMRAAPLRFPRQRTTHDTTSAASAMGYQQQQPQTPDIPPSQQPPPRAISPHTLNIGLSSFLDSSAISGQNPHPLASRQYSQQRQHQDSGSRESSAGLSILEDPSMMTTNPLRPSTTWDTVRTPEGDLWVGPPPSEWREGSGGPFG